MDQIVSENEIVLSEIEAISTIFGDSATFTNSNGTTSFNIKVVANFSNSSRNFMTGIFSGSFPSGYPDEPLQDIQLKIEEGTLPGGMTEYFQDLLRSESLKLIGEPMLYVLIDKLREQLEEYNEDITEGEFLLLSNEVRYTIFTYLEAIDLARLSCTNKMIRVAADDNGIWEEVCHDEFGELDNIPEEVPPRYFKDLYMKRKGLAVPDLPLMLAVRSRIDTGDSFPIAIEDGWMPIIRQEMYTYHQLVLPEKLGRIFLQSTRMGYIRLVSKDEGDYIIKKDPELWENFQSTFRREENCPYLGEIVGYLRFHIADELRMTFQGLTFVDNLLESARGPLIRLDQRMCEVAVKRKVVLINHILSGKEDLPWIVKPNRVKKRISYLNEVVEQLNLVLTPLYNKDRKNARGKANGEIIKPIAFADVQILYPFRLHPHLEPPTTESIKIWMLNGDVAQVANRIHAKKIIKGV
eukprot:TRINITY_DN60_c0_g2_i1.p1 TRINITY_DN60_c0_g2~~TRINITY_DN60_c0_g2_i1.p1  ORF type:complete len:466 (-),score=102.99 TRINITY_DN60_c0_g2_i1:14-1411(-)